MPFDATPYENRFSDINFPVKSDYEKTFFYKGGKCVALKKQDFYYYPDSLLSIEPENLDDLLFGTVREKMLDIDTLRKDRNLVYEKENEIMNDFKEAVLDHYDVPLTYPKRDTLFEKARSLAPSSSLQSIVEMVEELADLVP